MITENIKSVWVCREPIDFRKGANSLANIVQDKLLRDPFEGDLFIFTNRRHNCLKCLWYDGTGIWMFYKRLNKGTFKWKVKEDAVQITEQQLRWLLEGLDMEQKRAFTEKRPQLA